MNAMHVAQRMTADEFLALGYDGIPTWLVEGEVVVNQPGRPHQRSLRAMLRALDGWARVGRSRARSRPLDVGSTSATSSGPTSCGTPGARPARREGAVPHPDLAVEVRSPSTWRYDVGAKKAAYERGGLAELWLVDTVAEVVRVFRRSEPAAPAFDVVLEVGAGEQLTSPQLPGFALSVSALFAAEAGN